MTQNLEQRVLVCAPYGRDSRLIVKALADHGILGAALDDIQTLEAEIEQGSAAVILSEEVLHSSVDMIIQAMKKQPTWSDLPLIVLTTGSEASAESTWGLVRDLGQVGNVSLLERPLRSMTLISAVQVALRSRLHQYELRSMHEDLERRVSVRTAELQRLNAEAEGFSYAIAHDLRSPLRAIIGTSHVILEDYGSDLPAGAVHELNIQVEEAMRMATLINDLLQLSRLSQEEMCPVAFDYTGVAQEVVEQLGKSAEIGKCLIEVQPDMTAYGDPLLIRFAVLNLMQNACKFSPEGGNVRVGKSNGTYFVADEGIGFSQEYAQKIFRPFERLWGRDAFPGTGIGLANVRRIVERHGGLIWADSKEGDGTTFSFTLSKN
jgi:signal transduction histidine kinase